MVYNNEKEVFHNADYEYEAVQAMINRDYYDPEVHDGGESSTTYGTYSRISVGPRL